MTLGFSIDDYYVATDDDEFGFGTIGVEVGIPLCTCAYGDIALTAGATALFLGDAAEAANNGDDSDWYAYAGVTLSY